MTARSVTLSGTGLHTGQPCRVTLERSAGPVGFAIHGTEAPIDAIVVVDTTRSTTIRVNDTLIRTVEHLLAAFAGEGVRTGVTIRVDGPEVPLLDGASARWVLALAALGTSPSPARLAVVRDETIDVGESHYTFERGATTSVAVDLDLGDPRLAKHAEWNGAAEDFRERIAAARTFTLHEHIEELESLGAVKHIEPESVVVIGEVIGFAGNPFLPDEPARHKLIDLMGDAYLYGGPPRGRLTAFRPGHAANHQAFRVALERGIVA